MSISWLAVVVSTAVGMAIAGMKTLLAGVYAPAAIGTLWREFTFGHAC